MPPFRATSMSGLSQKVIRGIYDPIPSTYSSELRNVVKACLQVNHKLRPSCSKILAMPGVVNNLSETLAGFEKENSEN